MDQAQHIMTWWQHNITTQRHNMEPAQLIMTWWQHNITIQRHNMEPAQLIMTWWRHNITIQRHNMEEVQLIMIWKQHNITIQRHNMEQAQHESMTLSLRQSWRSILTCMPSLMKKHTMVSSLSCLPAYFHICLLRPWPLTSKINWVHPLTMANMYSKFDEEAHNC